MRAVTLLEGVPAAGEAEAPSHVSRSRRAYARPVVVRLRLENVVRGGGGTKPNDPVFPSTTPWHG